MPANVTAEYKAEIIKRMLAPNNESVPSLSKETGLTKSRLYEWKRKELKRLGVSVVLKASTLTISLQGFLLVLWALPSPPFTSLALYLPLLLLM